MNRIYCMLVVFILYCFPKLYGQENISTDTLAEELVVISASSATVSQWFDRIEKETGIILSYNPSAIDLEQRCIIERTGSITVSDLLNFVLKDYRFTIVCMYPCKIVIRILGRRNFYLSGVVSEEKSKERLYGAVIMLEDSIGNKRYTMADENGRFRIFVPEGIYSMFITYMGYAPYRRYVKVDREIFLRLCMKPLAFEIDEVTVKSYRRGDELDELSPANMLSFSNNDLFSQIWILPGVTGLPSGHNFRVDGGSGDENQILLDGVPVFHPGHMNIQFPMFNGDAVKNIIFHKGYFPTKFAGRLSSVTEVNLKDGNKEEHHQTLNIDMPAASFLFEGPVIQNRLSYMFSARRSWMDFFDDMFSEEERMNHSTYDYNAKFSYFISPRSSCSAIAYGAMDDYRLPDENGNKNSVLRWSNQVYKLSYNTMFGKFGNSTSLYYSSYQNRASASDLGVESEQNIKTGISSLNFSSEFTYSAENIYNARMGVSYSAENYELSSFTYEVQSRKEPIHQFSIFYDNNIQIYRNIQAQVGVHFVGYIPKNYKSYYSIQPRFSLRYTPFANDLLYFHFSKMEQFYHYIRFESIALPTDFSMPAIGAYKPRESEHYELGWKHFVRKGYFELSAYYKTRRNLLALKPETFVFDSEWGNYLMSGDGASYGAKCYFFGDWKKWSFQFSYTYSRSKEWFELLRDKGRLPSLYDVPHQLGCALSYKINPYSVFSAGGILHSGKVVDIDDDWEPVSAEMFRAAREKFNYRVDLGYTYKKNFRGNLFLLRLGLYNVIGNPSEEEILSFYSVHWYRNCIPYGGISFRF